MRAAAPHGSRRKSHPTPTDSEISGEPAPRCLASTAVPLDPRIPVDQVIEGDCEEVLRGLPDACVDLIVTSPPYADARARTYGGVAPDDYVAWFIDSKTQGRQVDRKRLDRLPIRGTPAASLGMDRQFTRPACPFQGASECDRNHLTNQRLSKRTG